MVPFIRRIYGKRGRRPTLKVNTEVGRRIYAASAVSPLGDFSYEVREQAFTGEAMVAFVKRLLGKAKQKVLIIWDHASIHDCRATRRFLESEPEGATVYFAQYPTYSPELNADEQVWHQIKCVGLKNGCYQNIKELKPKVIQELEKLKRNPELIKQFFYHSKVGFYD